jgi:N-acetylglucosaminyl-diphospho-decaprenol L-rhamnosyltransferase
MSITVAILNFNGKDQLRRLLPQVRAHGFRHIVVLDDASTDGSVGWLATQSDVITIAGEENLGPPGNRNRLLHVPTEDIILFLDNDMELLGSDNATAVAAEFKRYPEAAVIGPLIYSTSDEPMWYNWGHDFRPYRWGLAEALNRMAVAHWGNPAVMATIREIAQGAVSNFEPVEDREADWVVEMFFAVRADVFSELNGFDEKFRMFHASPDFCLRARNAGHKVRFTTSFAAKHLDQRTGTTDARMRDNFASTSYYFRKHFGLSEDVIIPLILTR